jgi:predicted N-acetyltransferase YhbS
MTEVRYRQLPRLMLPLVNKFYRRYRSKMRARGDEKIWVAEDMEIRGAVRLRPVEVGSEVRGHWLTGLFVCPDGRNQGIAGELVKNASMQVGAPIWLFCHPELSQFYERFGFREVATLPESLASRLVRYQQTQSLTALELSALPKCSRNTEPS